MIAEVRAHQIFASGGHIADTRRSLKTRGRPDTNEPFVQGVEKNKPFQNTEFLLL
jgi:hypothetical protein